MRYLPYDALAGLCVPQVHRVHPCGIMRIVFENLWNRTNLTFPADDRVFLPVIRIAGELNRELNRL